MLYKIDMGNTTAMVTLNELEELYADKIDHTGYTSFEDWMADMERSGLVKRKEV